MLARLRRHRPGQGPARRCRASACALRANRRFFPAFSQPVPGARAPRCAGAAGRSPQVALLAGGVAGRDGLRRRRPRRRPAAGTDPRDPGAARSAARRSPTRCARSARASASCASPGSQDGEEFARTDELLAGLERTVDPDRDGDTADHDRVALIGVSAPYAGFADAPEAARSRAPRRLGTLVVAPAGDEGAAAGAYGTVGSPGGVGGRARRRGADRRRRAVARTTLRGRRRHA